MAAFPRTDKDGQHFHSSFACPSLDQFWRRQWHPTPVLLPGKSHGWRSLVGCRPWGREESDTTERLHFHFSLSCIGEGNGNPLQCCCLENPRDEGSWWAAVYGAAQSRTRLKRLSSSSSSLDQFKKFIGFCGHNIIDYILKLKSLAVKIINVTSDRVEGGHISERIALEVKDMDGKLQHVYMNRESLLQGHERKTGD